MKFKIIPKIVFIIFCLSLTSCKINQTRNGIKQGKWIETKNFMTIQSSTVGRYQKGNKTGKWKSYTEEKLVTEEKFRKNSCHIIKYHNTGKIQQIGYSKKVMIKKKAEWLPTGKWTFYDSEGVLLGTKIYENGMPIEEIYTK